MALEDILREVEERSAEEREKISKEYDQKKNDAARKADMEIDGLKDEFRKKTSDDSASYERREKDLMGLEAKRIVDSRRNGLIAGEAAKAADLVRDAGNLLNRADLQEMMLKACRKNLGDDIRIRCSPESEKFFKGKAGEVTADLKMEEQGIICVSSDGRREINLTMEFILKDISESILDGISRKARVV